MYEKIKKLSKELNSEFIYDYDVSKLTWFRTGGKSDIYCLVENEFELKLILKNLEKVTYYIIGMGSNLLIRDRGFRGIIIKLGKSFNKITVEDEKIVVGASILDINLSKFAFTKSIEDLEFFSGVPGTIGGAVKMNAGCFGSETKDVLYSITTLDKYYIIINN